MWLERTWIFSWWWAWTFFLRGAERDSRPPWSTWKRRSSFPLTMWKEKGGPFLGVSLSVTTSCRMLLPMGSPSCGQRLIEITFQIFFSSLLLSASKALLLEPSKMAPASAFRLKLD